MTHTIIFGDCDMTLVDADEETVDWSAIRADRPQDAEKIIDDWAKHFPLDAVQAKRDLQAFLELERLFAKIAKLQLRIPTLETRKLDSLDFHEVAVWSVRSALLSAYDAGRKSVMNE